MPNRPIIQTDLDGNKSINFSDGGRWDDGQPEDKLFKGVLQAPTKMCYEKVTGIYDEEEIVNCKPVSYWISEQIGWKEVCDDISQVQVPPLSEGQPLGSSAALDFSQFDINQPAANRILPMPDRSIMPPPRRNDGTERYVSLLGYARVSSDITNSTTIPLKQVPWSDDNYPIYVEGTWPSRLESIIEKTPPLVTAQGVLPIQSGIEVKGRLHLGLQVTDGYRTNHLKINEPVTLASGTRIAIRQQIFNPVPERPTINHEPPPPPNYRVCHDEPIFGPVEKNRVECKKSVVLNKLPDREGFVPCAWEQDFGDATEGSPAVKRRSLNEKDYYLSPKYKRPKGKSLAFIKEQAKLDYITHIKFNPDADIKQITGSTITLGRNAEKALSLRVKVKFKTRKVVRDNTNAYFRPRSHLPVSWYQQPGSTTTPSGISSIVTLAQDNNVHLSAVGEDLAVQEMSYTLGGRHSKIFSMEGHAGNKISPNDYKNSNCIHPYTPLEGRPIGMTIFDHQMLRNSEINTINEERFKSRINAPFYGEEPRDGAIIQGPYLDKTYDTINYSEAPAFAFPRFFSKPIKNHSTNEIIKYVAGIEQPLIPIRWSNVGSWLLGRGVAQEGKDASKTTCAVFMTLGYTKHRTPVFHPSQARHVVNPGGYERRCFDNSRGKWDFGGSLYPYPYASNYGSARNYSDIDSDMENYIIQHNPMVAGEGNSLTKEGFIKDPAVTKNDLFYRYLNPTSRKAYSVPGATGSLPDWAKLPTQSGSSVDYTIPNKYWDHAVEVSDGKLDITPTIYSVENEWAFWGNAQADRGLTMHSSSFIKKTVGTNNGNKVDDMREMEGEFEFSAYNCTDLKLRFYPGIQVDYIIEWYWEAVDYDESMGTHSSVIQEVCPVNDCRNRYYSKNFQLTSDWQGSEATLCKREPGKYGG